MKSEDSSNSSSSGDIITSLVLALSQFVTGPANYSMNFIYDKQKYSSTNNIYLYDRHIMIVTKKFECLK